MEANDDTLVDRGGELHRSKVGFDSVPTFGICRVYDTAADRLVFTYKNHTICKHTLFVPEHCIVNIMASDNNVLLLIN